MSLGGAASMRPGPSWGEGEIEDTFWQHKTNCGGPKAQLWGLDMGGWGLKGLAGHGGWKWLGTGDMAPHQGLHHIGFVVPKRFGSKENVHQVVAANHLQDRGAGAEGAAAATPISK